MITQDQLKELLDYNPDTGIFIWRKVLSNFIKVGDVAGSVNDAGYIVINVLGKKHRAHKLAWLYMFGEYPDCILDHRDLDGSNNRICNLRKASKAQNALNTTLRADNTSGYKGVSWNKKQNKWVAKTKTNGKYITLGMFKKIEDAAMAYREFAIKHYGEFARFE